MDRPTDPPGRVVTAFLVFVLTVGFFTAIAYAIHESRWRRLNDRTRPGMPGDHRHRTH